MTTPAASEAPDSTATSPRSTRGLRRGTLRNDTFILPNTGERVRRQITLRGPTRAERLATGPNGRNPLDSILRSLRGTPTEAGIFERAVESTADATERFWQWLKTPIAKGILKCSLAYLLGSMGTFFPPLASFLGQQDGKHLVATITVYFHPARSAGSMEEAVLLGLGAFSYATFVGISSMAVSVYFEQVWQQIELAYALIIILFIGGGLGFVGWIKQRYSAPLVSVACSLAALAIITIITKENAVQVGVFSNDKIVQVMKMVILGICSTAAVSLLVWPISARTELRDSLIRTTDSLSDMLILITRGFLSGSETDLRSSAFETAQSTYRTVFIQLTKNLGEAKFEHYMLGTEDQYKIEASLVLCMQRLQQSIGGLRSAATTQFSLLREARDIGSSSPIATKRQFPAISEITESPEGSLVLSSEEQISEDSGVIGRDMDLKRPTGNRRRTMSGGSTNQPSVRTPAEIFSRFMAHLGPSMKSLAYTLSQILKELPFTEGPEYAIKINDHFKTSLSDALSLYSNARADALKQLYRTKELDRERPESIEIDFEEVAASCGHFSFSLLDFANEMQNYLSILEELSDATSRRSRSWKWLLFWRKGKSRSRGPTEEEEALIAPDVQTALPKNPTDVVLQRRETRKWRAAIANQTSAWGINSMLLRGVRFFGRDDVRFAFKVGIGASLYALFAFIPATRPFYQHWRGEWGLLSYMLVCAMTIGASNTTGWSRFLGTFIGAIIAVCVWALCQGNAFALIFCGWLVSLPCFYIIVAKDQGPFGRFIMLTYNLSCLYAYSMSVKDSDSDDDEGGVQPVISEIVLHRVVAVLAGCIWGLVITRLIWPISARKKFKDGLSMLWLRMGLIWKTDPMLTILKGQSSHPYMNFGEESALQRYVSRLNKLRNSAVSEFELRGPFQSSAYETLMDSTSKMLDSFHSMNLVLEKHKNASEGEKLLLQYTAEERAQLCSRISHLFQVLASGLKLEFPINDALPDTTNSRDRLLAKIFQYRKEAAVMGSVTVGQTQTQMENGNGNGRTVAKDEDYELLYAFILVTAQLGEEIKKVQREVEDLFGVLDEAIFELQ